MNFCYGEFLIRWPCRDEVRATLPKVFRKDFPQYVANIDCTEIFIEWSSDLKAQAQTWSQYKHHIIVRSRVRGSTRFRNPRAVAMVSERSEDTIPTARGFLNRVDPIGRVI